MYTQCPHCQTCFRIAEDHLKIANGKVRCGSCQEVFDATQRLFKNLSDREPVVFNPTKPKPSHTAPTKPVEPPHRASTKTGNIDLNRATTPSPQAVEKILQERQKTPDQSPFMESTLGNDRYNNLDQMNPINIPGQIDFGDSIIQFPDEQDKPANKKTTSSAKPDLLSEVTGVPPAAKTTTPTPAQTAASPHITKGAVPSNKPDLTAKIPDAPQTPKTAATTPSQSPASPRTVYEDIESKDDAPVTEDEQAALENFFAEVDAQLLEPGENKSQLDKDIDELLAFANGLDKISNPTQVATPTEPEPDIDVGAPVDTQGIEVSEEFDMQAIADFEKELEASNPGVFSRADKDNTASQAELDDALAGDESTSHDTTTNTPEPTVTSTTDSVAPAESDKPEPVNETQVELDEDEVPRALRSSLQMLNQTQRRSPVKTLLMSLVILVLLGGLAFQVVLFRNVELAHKFPQLIPELTQFCSRLPCRYSGKVDVSQIKLLNRDVRSDPNMANALLISATFVDKARFDQPYPIIKITLYDLGGNVVASRRFTPKEYLQKMYNRFLLMESGTPVHITLAVLDPGKDAINFEFKFLSSLQT